MIFHDDLEIVQMFISAESEAMMELPTAVLIEGIAYLMAAYYVLDVQYPKVCIQTFFFFQDVIMDKSDSPRPIRYSTYIKNMGF